MASSSYKIEFTHPFYIPTKRQGMSEKQKNSLLAKKKVWLDWQLVLLSKAQQLLYLFLVLKPTYFSREQNVLISLF